MEPKRVRHPRAMKAVQSKVPVPKVVCRDGLIPRPASLSVTQLTLGRFLSSKPLHIPDPP